MRHPELFQQLGIEPPKGVLLHAPPGTGKTLMAKAVANEIDAYFTTISGPEIMSKYYGESEEQLRGSSRRPRRTPPAIVFIDEIDSIAPKRGGTQGDVERRVVAQLLSLMDGLEERGQVIVIGATNRVDAIDPALRRGGRFDREIGSASPTGSQRKSCRSTPAGCPGRGDRPRRVRREHPRLRRRRPRTTTKESAMNALRRIRPNSTSNPTDRRRGPGTAGGQRGRLQGRDEGHLALGAPRSVRRGPGRLLGGRRWPGGRKERLRETIQWPLE